MLRLAVPAWFAVVAMAAFLVAAPASATPESDADAAITAAWEAAGGVDSPLGDKDGGVYAAGSGFVQNFHNDGAIYFTPETGAHIMYGRILDRYRELGGPVDSDLGFPTVDEGVGRVSADSRSSEFSAADHPVMFWTPDTDAWVVRGAINAAWDHLGGSAGVMGVPTADESYNGSVITQSFSGGTIAYDTATGAFTEPADHLGELAGLPIPGDASSAINTAWRIAGGKGGPLGAREGDPAAVGDAGTVQNFAGGKIFYTADTGAHALTGPILERYESAGGPTGELGFPTSGVVDGGVPDGTQASFAAAEHPVIFATPDHGAIVVNGPVKAAWDKLGGATGPLGVPVAEHDIDRDVMTQKFSGGELTFNATDRKFSVTPDALAGQLEGVEVANTALPTTPAPPSVAAKKGTGAGWSWLWWLLPAAALVLILLLVWQAARRRKKAPAVVAGDDADAEYLRQGYGRGQDYDRQGDYDRPDAYDYDEPEYHEAGYRTDDQDGHYDEPGYDSHSGWREDDLGAPAPSWEDENSGTTEVVIHDELFTHQGSHARRGEDVDDQDAVDTAPTRYGFSEDIVVDETPSGRHAVAESASSSLLPPLPDWGDKYGQFEDYSSGYREPAPGADYSSGPAAYAAEPAAPERVAEPVEEAPEPAAHGDSAYPAIHLPLDDPNQAPPGFPIKACMRSGNYHLPGGAYYEETVADIWFADEEHAQANGFHRAD
ncbi:hypothetical protein MINS_22440 [Mycolicibacterium insubricum]|uniref:LGFP repeat-containing protein n=2 Tax=Mycolicibacterium insubricum TaxID=444597 RepID=UPI00138B3A71|nr:hypothetical protein [Mycolicibacterium insubricum]BBZ66815.1 hypothetical protein MINS_22440 [Mycolicibacterium insubricum]